MEPGRSRRFRGRKGSGSCTGSQSSGRGDIEQGGSKTRFARRYHFAPCRHLLMLPHQRESLAMTWCHPTGA